MKLVAWIRSMLAALADSGVAAPKLVRERNPVVLVHGIYSDSRDMARIAHYLRRNGWEVFTPDMTPADGRVDLDQLAS